MAYEKINWKNLPDTNTPVNAENLEKMDDQIEENTNYIEVLNRKSELNLLWQNNDTTIDFNEQDIQLINDNYDDLIVYYIEAKNSSYVYNKVIPKGYGGRLTTCFAPPDVNLACYSREMQRIDNTTFHFVSARLYYSYADGTQVNRESNDVIIPVLIYGKINE